MTYLQSLDEYPEVTLIEELLRRIEMRSKGLCDYCGRNPYTPPCKMINRHQIYSKTSEQTSPEKPSNV